ncbi:hypothetical protein ABEF92_007048 [Exophiala dermatitidis]|uniref:Pheromone a factor receptor n=1 Tax=Exophiala dermatitidis (strain ATCC 34100 / CBS 525.76 / NIH/UT8656) TaxID=858893 RepID=H6C7X9_EXODN|nr:pheromone a factor receptor [Exophiala dermatitidis NIH/UT8656]EHY60206.1 pheromone a factor receptor [Exophiala dermatitidis NIH/UT8656]
MYWTAAAVLTPLLALLACLLSIPPLIVHFQARNFAATVLILGVTILNVQNLVNALIWASEDFNTWWDGKILCDIEVKLYIGIAIAADGAVTSIFRQIAGILDTKHMTVTASPQSRRRRLVIEVLLCIVFPTLIMAAHYLVQNDRYWIRTSAGCTPTFSPSWPTVFLIFLWPVVICLAGSVYCVLSVIRLWVHRKEMSSVLSNTPGVTTSRFLRLFALSFTLLLGYCPVAILTFDRNIRVQLHPYSWSYIHPPDWSEKIILVPDPGRLSIDRWAQIATGYVFFLFFGLGAEARQMYTRWIQKARDLRPRGCILRRKA